MPSMNQAGSLLCGKGVKFEMAYLFWPVVCNMRDRVSYVGHDVNSKILSGNHSKSMCAQNHHFLTFWPTPLVHVSTLLILPIHPLCMGVRILFLHPFLFSWHQLFWQLLYVLRWLLFSKWTVQNKQQKL